MYQVVLVESGRVCLSRDFVDYKDCIQCFDTLLQLFVSLSNFSLTINKF